MADLTRLIDFTVPCPGLAVGDVIATPSGPPARVVDVLEDFDCNGNCLLAQLDDGRWVGVEPHGDPMVFDTLPELAQRLWAGGKCHEDVLLGLFRLGWLSLSDKELRREAAAARPKVVVKQPPATRGRQA